jgi:hypothetical protein
VGPAGVRGGRSRSATKAGRCNRAVRARATDLKARSEPRGRGITTTRKAGRRSEASSLRHGIFHLDHVPVTNRPNSRSSGASRQGEHARASPARGFRRGSHGPFGGCWIHRLASRMRYRAAPMAAFCCLGHHGIPARGRLRRDDGLVETPFAAHESCSSPGRCSWRSRRSVGCGYCFLPPIGLEDGCDCLVGLDGEEDLGGGCRMPRGSGRWSCTTCSGRRSPWRRH